MFVKRFSIILLIFIFSAVNIFAQTQNSDEGSPYIKNEEEAKAAYSLALYYKEKALASKTITEETLKDLESSKVILQEVLKCVQNKEIYITLAETHEALGEYYESSRIYDKLVLDNPEDAELLIKAAERNIFVINDIKKAQYYLQNAYELDPSNNDALILLGFTYYQSKELEKAIFYFSKVNENGRASNNYIQYYNFYYGMSEFYLSRFSNAIIRLNKLQDVQLSPTDKYTAAYGIVKSYQALEKYNEAYSNSLIVDDSLFLSAYLSFMSDKYNKELFSEIDTMDSRTPKILTIILEAQNNGYSNALNMIEADLDRREIDLDIIQAYYKMIDKIGNEDNKMNAEMDIISFYLMLNNIDALPSHIDKLISYDNTGKFNNLYLQAALEFKNQNNFKASKEMINKYLSLKNNNIRENELVSLVLTATEIGESSLAINAIDKFEKEKYSYSYLRAYSYLFDNDINNANKYLQEDLEYFNSNKSNTNEYRLNIPYITALAANNTNSALMYANYKYSQDETSAQNMNSLAWALVSLGTDIDRAIELSKNAVQLEPNSPHYIDTLGFAYYKKGDYDNALKTLLKAVLYVDENSKAEIYHHIADAYYAKNDYKNALKYYRKSISSINKEFDYDEEGVKDKIESLTEDK
ncbi:tetratricopeptide repeat protein [uncultured Brachyspira sp.]|uniref:tetratricopeptide repeat protein n=1 Tax=uncultured Brachyspira sp. TaxID=221953 RepID=UPI002605750C|nr:tetratricopeptide repeat protein [uncultured Brachyspira sp.]